MKKSEHESVEDFNKKYSTTLKVLSALLLEFRISKDGNCFNKHCPFHVPIKNYYVPIKDRTAFLCKMCQQHFYVMADSIMYKSHIKPEHWFQIIYLMLSSRNGISACEVARRYGYHEPGVLRLMHAVRRQMGKCMDWCFENTIIEIDGAGVKTGRKGYSKHHRFNSGRGSQRNSSVLVIKERGKRVKLYHIPSENSDSVLRIMKEEVDKETCLIITDEYTAYNTLKDNGYQHLIINHSSEKKKPKHWKVGTASTNYAEGIFSVLKRNIRGAHIHVTSKYLQNYLNECAFKLTYADEKDYGFSILITSFGSLEEHYKDKFKAFFNPKKAA